MTCHDCRAGCRKLGKRQNRQPTSATNAARSSRGRRTPRQHGIGLIRPDENGDRTHDRASDAI
jgi:hypothetical protein